MTLRKDRIILLAAGALMLVGCRSVGLESMQSAQAPNTNKYPYKGDPYAWGGIQEGTGGQVAGTKQTMESPKYQDPPKFERLAGPEAAVSMSGHKLSKAKGNDRVGDYQPPHGDEPEEGGHGEEGH